jgi:putative holliday junction resolvase
VKIAKAKNGLYRQCSTRERLTDSEIHERAGRILALDVGKKRIGMAISDELGITAQGLQTLERTRIRDDVRALKEVTERLDVTMLLVGRPLHMNGSESRQSEYTREFAERLGKDLSLPVVYWDERLTSAEAERALREGGATLEQRKKSVDRMAAILLLESYLASLRNAAGALEESFE